MSTPASHTHSTFTQLADFLEPGDLLVVNHSATLPASLPAQPRRSRGHGRKSSA